MENEGNDDNRRIDEEDDLNEIDLNQIEIAVVLLFVSKTLIGSSCVKEIRTL